MFKFGGLLAGKLKVFSSCAGTPCYVHVASVLHSTISMCLGRCREGIPSLDTRVYFTLKNGGLYPFSYPCYPNGFHIHVHDQHHKRVKSLKIWSFHPFRKKLRENPAWHHYQTPPFLDMLLKLEVFKIHQVRIFTCQLYHVHDSKTGMKCFITLGICTQFVCVPAFRVVTCQQEHEYPYFELHI